MSGSSFSTQYGWPMRKYIIGKIDHYFSSNTTINGHYSYDDTTVISPDAYGEKLSGAPARKITRS